MNTIQEDTNRTISQLKAALDFGIVQQATHCQGQSCIVANNQARETDIRALSDLTRALDKKVTEFIIHSLNLVSMYFHLKLLVFLIEMEVALLFLSFSWVQ